MNEPYIFPGDPAPVISTYLWRLNRACEFERKVKRFERNARPTLARLNRKLEAAFILYGRGSSFRYSVFGKTVRSFASFYNAFGPLRAVPRGYGPIHGATLRRARHEFALAKMRARNVLGRAKARAPRYGLLYLEALSTAEVAATLHVSEPEAGRLLRRWGFRPWTMKRFGVRWGVPRNFRSRRIRLPLAEH